MTRTVHIVGSGLIGGSLGIALTRAGYQVTITDVSPTAAALAQDLGAGTFARPECDPDVVVVATPPDVAAQAIVEALTQFPNSVVTDTASVKQSLLEQVSELGGDLTRYVGAHPMAGRERSGVVSARGDLFEGRVFVVAPGPDAIASAVDQVAELGRALRSAVVIVEPAEHDAAVAAVSHVPQVMASLVAARLHGLTDTAIGLAGPGVRDVTRIAESDPGLWTQILCANAESVGEVLGDLADDLDRVRRALAQMTDGPGTPAPGARAAVAQTIADGNRGHARLPGKHGGASAAYETLTVLVPDKPGELARLLADVGKAGVNIEDLHLEHGIGQPFGLAELVVIPAAAPMLADALTTDGWRLHS